MPTLTAPKVREVHLYAALERLLAEERAPVQTLEAAPDDWEAWLRLIFPQYTRHPFARHHEDLWDVVWSVELGEYTPPFLAIWPRGGAKSTSAELAAAGLAARKRRRYALYVCSVQERADDHVTNIAGMLESERFSHFYPDASERMLSKFGSSRGWRRNRLRTASGFIVDAVGLDTASRGIKIEEQRPDLIILDDLDDVLDGPGVVERKITTLTQSLLPTATDDAFVIGVQNLIHSEGIFAQLADDRADFLADRVVSGPIPALHNIAYETNAQGKTQLVAGEPTWEGQDLAACQRFVDRDGLSAFLIEAQHETELFAKGMFAHVEFRHCTWDEVPWNDLVRSVVWCDPAVTDKDTSDANGIQADALAKDGTIYRLFSWEQRGSPEETLSTAILKAVELKAEHVGIETDQGGDVWRPAYAKVWDDLVKADKIAKDARRIPCVSDKAGAGHGPKAHRGSLQLVDYERGRFVHVIGTHGALERALRRFLVRKPYDLADASYWSWQDLAGKRQLRAY